ncbi:MAG: class I SAM-dependent methyltransferase [Hyphococcus sp.]
MRYLLLSASALALAACGEEAQAPADQTTDAAAEETADAAEETAASADAGAMTASERLDAVLAAQPEDAQARYQFRHPKETLTFVGVEPGMTVLEALPGGGWYSKILLPYLGADGKLIGADYSMDMWPLFGGFATEEFLEGRKTWPTDWPAQTAEWGVEDAAAVEAFAFGSMPEDIAGTADAVLFIRALHNLSRFEDEGGFRSEAITEAFTALKPGGVAGVVQHRAPADSSDEWADGSRGYLKQGAVVAAFEAAGFELVEVSEINANPNDQPTEDDIVWRLPPTFGTSQDNAELRAEMEAIGESDRMTLKFRKPE